MEIEFTVRQKQAWDALWSDTVTEVMYGGAKGGGKSVFLCTWVFAMCLWIIQEYGLKPSSNPIHAGWMGRKQGTDFTATTLATWRRIIPQDRYAIRGGTEKDPRHILIDGRVAVDFGGLDKQENINKFNSAEYGFIALDQAEETTLDDVSVLRASRRLKINDRPLPYKGLYTANPGQCWLKSEFVDNPRADHVFIPALPKDNPHLPTEYVKTLQDAFSYRPELLRAYLEGDWGAMDGANQVIKSEWLLKAAKLDVLQFRPLKRRLLTCDVARNGDDETVIYDMEETAIVGQEIYGQKDTMYTANVLTKMSMERGDCAIAVDEIGVGGGVVDRLKELGRTVYAINSCEKSDNPKCFNRRAEIWENAAEMFSNGDVELHLTDTVLKNQLLSPTFSIRGSKILIESKEDIKKRLRRSPDRADAYVNGLYALRFVQPAASVKPARRHTPSYVTCGVG